MGILTDDMKRVITEQSLGFVATVCPDGTPNVSPKGTVTVWDDDHLVFADIRSPTTMRNIRTNPVVEINVVDPILRKGYRFKGEATIHTDGQTFEDARRFYGERGIADDLERIRGVALLRVERALPLTSPAYDLGLTEDEVRQRWTSRVLGRGAEAQQG